MTRDIQTAAFRIPIECPIRDPAIVSVSDFSIHHVLRELACFYGARSGFFAVKRDPVMELGRAKVLFNKQPYIMRSRQRRIVGTDPRIPANRSDKGRLMRASRRSRQARSGQRERCCGDRGN